MKLQSTRVLSPTQRVLLAASSLLVLSCIARAVRAEGAATAPTGVPTKVVRTYTPKAGENLDQVIKQTMADSPLRIELLRKAVVDLNPAAFVSGNPARMRAKFTLQLPDHTQLAQTVLARQAASNDVAAADEKHGRSGPTSGVTDERRHWVRFP